MVVCAAGSMPGDLHKLWRTRDRKGYHVEYGFSCMGYEIAGGIGVRLAAPDRDVFVTVGDGSYLMMPTELVTAVAGGHQDHRGAGAEPRLRLDRLAGGIPWRATVRHQVPLPRHRIRPARRRHPAGRPGGQRGQPRASRCSGRRPWRAQGRAGQGQGRADDRRAGARRHRPGVPVARRRRLVGRAGRARSPSCDFTQARPRRPTTASRPPSARCSEPAPGPGTRPARISSPPTPIANGRNYFIRADEVDPRGPGRKQHHDHDHRSRALPSADAGLASCRRCRTGRRCAVRGRAPHVRRLRPGHRAGDQAARPGLAGGRRRGDRRGARRPGRRGGTCRWPAGPRCCSAFRELLNERKHEAAEIITSRARQGALRRARRGTRGQEVVEFACGLAHLLKGSLTENASTKVDVVLAPAAAGCGRRSSRRSTSRRWCRCGSSRSRSPPATRRPQAEREGPVDGELAGRAVEGGRPAGRGVQRRCTATRSRSTRCWKTRG